MIVMIAILLLASIGAGILGVLFLSQAPLLAVHGPIVAAILFLIAAVLFSAGAIIDAIRLLRNDLRTALLDLTDHLKPPLKLSG